MLNQNSRPQSFFVSQATPSADQINQDLKNRYGDLLNQADQESGKLKTTPLLQSPKLLEQLDPKLTAEMKQKQQELQQSQTQPSSSILDPFLGLPLPVQTGIGVATGFGVITFGVLGARGLSTHFKTAQYLKQFDQGPGQKIQAYLAKEPKQLAWWDQPRWGKKVWGNMF